MKKTLEQQFEEKFPKLQQLYNTNSGYCIQVDPYEVIEFIKNLLNEKVEQCIEELPDSRYYAKELMDDSPTPVYDMKIKTWNKYRKQAIDKLSKLISK